MNDPHVVALNYSIEHEVSVDYSEATPICREVEGFNIRIEDNCVRFEMKQHYAAVEAAMEAVEPYIRSWELDVALRGQPGEFRLKLDTPEIVDRKPTPGKVELVGSLLLGELSFALGTVIVGKSYPQPPAEVSLKRNGKVLLMYARYEDYCKGREKLTNMAYFCFTVLKQLGGGSGKGVREKYGISGGVLDTFSRLANKGGSAEARKAGNLEGGELTPEERRFLQDAVKKFIRRVAEEAQSPKGSFPKITKADLPELQPFSHSL